MGCLKLHTVNNTDLKISWVNKCVRSEKSEKKARSVYVYGFNGKETDTETDLQDYGMRIYNPSLGRFLSVDPLTKSYPWYTPYQFAGNKPIWAVDLDGEEEFIKTDFFNAVGQLYRTEITVVNQAMPDANGRSTAQIVHNNEVRPITNAAGQTTGYNVQYTGTNSNVGNTGALVFRDRAEQLVALGGGALTQPGGGGLLFTPTTGANPQFTSQAAFPAPGGGVLIPTGPIKPAGNTLVLTDPNVPTPVPTPGPASTPAGNLPYLPLGINATPTNALQRTSGAGGPPISFGTAGTEIGAIGGGPGGVINFNNLPSQNARNTATGAGTRGNFTININSNFATPTTVRSVVTGVGRGRTVGGAGASRNNGELQAYANGNF
jgi:RHS repeat-associated protein